MAATNIATKLNQSKYDKRFLSIENTKKENYLNQLIDVVEMKLQESELNDIVDREAVEQDSYKEAIINSSYQELDIIDSLFIKTNFVDEISANLIMDEIKKMYKNLSMK